MTVLSDYPIPWWGKLLTQTMNLPLTSKLQQWDQKWQEGGAPIELTGLEVRALIEYLKMVTVP
jgi:hypothetical protein